MADREPRTARPFFSVRKGLGLFAVGVAVVMAGLAYDVMFAGIPFQDDPGPALARQYAANVAVAGRFYRAGSGLTVAGLIWIVVAVALRLWRRWARRPSQPGK